MEVPRDNNNIVTDTLDTFPWDTDVVAAAESEVAQFAWHNNADDFAAVEVNLQVADIAQPLALASIDDFFAAQVAECANLRLHIIR